MRKKLPTVISYLALLLLSLPVPFLHSYQTVKAIENMRPVFKLDDGSYVGTLMPMPILFLRWLGQLSWWIPFIILALFVISFWRDSLSRFTTISAIAICQCAFATIYALYSAYLLA